MGFFVLSLLTGDDGRFPLWLLRCALSAPTLLDRLLVGGGVFELGEHGVDVGVVALVLGRLDLAHFLRLVSEGAAGWRSHRRYRRGMPPGRALRREIRLDLRAEPGVAGSIDISVEAFRWVWSRTLANRRSLVGADDLALIMLRRTVPGWLRTSRGSRSAVRGDVTPACARAFFLAWAGSVTLLSSA